MQHSISASNLLIFLHEFFLYLNCKAKLNLPKKKSSHFNVYFTLQTFTEQFVGISLLHCLPLAVIKHVIIIQANRNSTSINISKVLLMFFEIRMRMNI